MVVHRLQRWTENIFTAPLRLMVSCKLTITIQHFLFLKHYGQPGLTLIIYVGKSVLCCTSYGC